MARRLLRNRATFATLILHQKRKMNFAVGKPATCNVIPAFMRLPWQQPGLDKRIYCRMVIQRWLIARTRWRRSAEWCRAITETLVALVADCRTGWGGSSIHDVCAGIDDPTH